MRVERKAGGLSENQALPGFAVYRFGIIPSVGQYQRVNDIPAGQTPPAVEMDGPGVVTKILEALIGHGPTATGTIRSGPVFSVKTPMF